MTAALAQWRGRHRLDVAGPHGMVVDLERTLDDGAMGDDLAVHVDDDMEATDGVVPVVVGEPLFLVVTEGGVQDRPDLGDLVGRQLARRQATQADSAIAFRVHATTVAERQGARRTAVRRHTAGGTRLHRTACPRIYGSCRSSPASGGTRRVSAGRHPSHDEGRVRGV